MSAKNEFGRFQSCDKKIAENKKDDLILNM